jgi:hypothetical protein
VAQLRAELSQVKQALAALQATLQVQASMPSTNAHLAPESKHTAGGITPRRILTPNPQNYWLRLTQPETGNTWSFASEPITGSLRLGSDSAPAYGQLRLDGSGNLTTGPVTLSKIGTADASQTYDSSDLTFQSSAWDQPTSESRDLTVALKMYPSDPDPRGVGYSLSLIDPDGFVPINLLDSPGPGGKEVEIRNDAGDLLFNLWNAEPGNCVFIRYFAGDADSPNFGQWLLGPHGGGTTPPGDFCLIRDWWWTAVKVEDDNGRVLIGRLDPYPPGEDPAEGRLHVRGLVDETQLVVDANGSQTGDVLHVRDSGGTNYLAVTNTGDTAVGASSQPRSIVLYDITNGSVHHLRVKNGKLELTTR